MSSFLTPVAAQHRWITAVMATAIAITPLVAPVGQAQADPGTRGGYWRVDRAYGRDYDGRNYDRDDYPVRRNVYQGEVIHNYKDNQFQLALPGGGYLRVTARPDLRGHFPVGDWVEVRGHFNRDDSLFVAYQVHRLERRDPRYR